MRRSVMPVLVVGAALLGSFALVRLPATVAQEATPAESECPTTTAEENKELVSQLYEAIAAADGAALAALVADDVVFHTPSRGTREGDPEGFLRSQRENFPDLTVTVDQLVAEGDTVAAYATWTGTLQDDTPVFFGEEVAVPATGGTAEWVGALFFRIECGKIAEVWPVSDRLGQFMDLGVITEDELRNADGVATPAP